ncbi:hypothetical protein B0H19DRAFT_1186182, partial [Mycena capillaripes]
MGPITAIGLYTRTIVLNIAAYIIWRLIVQITSTIPSALGIDTKHTIVVIDILGLEVRLPLERCATFKDFHSLIAERASRQRHRSVAKYVHSRAYEVTDKSNSAVIYPHVWARKVHRGMKVELAILLHRPSIACPWCGQENEQARWIHCDCGRTFEVSAASQMGPRDTPGERSTAFIEELPESSQYTSSSADFDSFTAEQGATSADDDQDELPFVRKIHVIFDDSKGKQAETCEVTKNYVNGHDVSRFGEGEDDINERLHREALALCAAPHPNRAASLGNLANALRKRFERKGNAQDLDEAIQLHQEALALRPGLNLGRVTKDSPSPSRPSSKQPTFKCGVEGCQATSFSQVSLLHQHTA